MAQERTVEEAVHRNSKAIISMDFATLMGDLTPEAMSKAMAAGNTMMQQLTDYKILSHAEEGEDHVFEVQYIGPSANVNGVTRWRNINGTWKIVDFSIKS